MNLFKGLASSVLVSGTFASAVFAADKPKVIIIYNDDMGYQDLGCLGAPNIKTPRVDQFAKEITQYFIAIFLLLFSFNAFSQNELKISNITENQEVSGSLIVKLDTVNIKDYRIASYYMNEKFISNIYDPPFTGITTRSSGTLGNPFISLEWSITVNCGEPM